MRIKGTVINFCHYTQSGFIIGHSTDEHYFFTRADICSSGLLPFLGLKVTFVPVNDKHELKACKVRSAVHRLNGHLLSVLPMHDKAYIKGDNGKTYWFILSQIMLTMQHKRIQENDKVQFSYTTGEHVVQHAFDVTCDNRLMLEIFCNTRLWKNNLENLSALAMPESWNYINLDTNDNPLLLNYITHTFQHAFEQGLISYFTVKSEKHAYACFNTGLVSKNNRDIMCVFRKTLAISPGPLADNGWAFNQFSDNEVYYLLQTKSALQAPRYVCKKGYNHFDPTLEIFTKFEKVLEHIKHKLPKSLVLQGDDACIETVNAAIQNSINSIRTGKIIPQPKYYRGAIEFIVPLYLGTDKDACMALVIKRSDDNSYFANTFITMDMAYKNARLLGPVNSTWLKPVYTLSDVPADELLHYAQG